MYCGTDVLTPRAIHLIYRMRIDLSAQAGSVLYVFTCTNTSPCKQLSAYERKIATRINQAGRTGQHIEVDHVLIEPCRRQDHVAVSRLKRTSSLLQVCNDVWVRPSAFVWTNSLRTIERCSPMEIKDRPVCTCLYQYLDDVELPVLSGIV
jgi:hypothetical protein